MFTILLFDLLNYICHHIKTLCCCDYSGVILFNLYRISSRTKLLRAEPYNEFQIKMMMLPMMFLRHMKILGKRAVCLAAEFKTDWKLGNAPLASKQKLNCSSQHDHKCTNCSCKTGFKRKLLTTFNCLR